MMVFHKTLYVLMALSFRIVYFLRDLREPTSSHFPVTAEYYPTGLGIEVTNLCNANCVFCAFQYRERSVSYMSFEMFQKVVDHYVSLGQDKTGIGLTPVVGDPLVDRDLEQKIAYAASIPQIKAIHMTTNAILLTRERFDRLADAGLNMMTISMSGFDANEYKRVYRTDHYATVIKNLRSIARSDQFQKCSVEIGLRTSSLLPWLRKGFWEFRFLGFKISRNWFFDNWSGRIKQSDLDGFMFIRPERSSKRTPCHMLYQGPLVYADGKVTACGCRDLEGTSELTLGDLRESSMAQILSQEKMELLRQRFINGNLPDVCRDCKHYSPMSFSRHRNHAKRQISHLPSPQSANSSELATAMA